MSRPPLLRKGNIRLIHTLRAYSRKDGHADVSHTPA